MKTLAALFAVLILSSNVNALDAGYYRAWQGFAKDGNKEKMIEVLPNFMQTTVDLYEKSQALSNYLVVLPPANSPSFIPNELALIALNNEAEYRRIRATPEGIAYGDSHWPIFDRATSSSAPLQALVSEASSLVTNTSYNVLGTPVDWSQGVNYVFIGLRKDKLSPAVFLERLKNHIQLTAQAMSSKGLRGYIVIANDNYEVAYMNWESSEAMAAAGATPEAQAAFADAQDIMDMLMWQQTKKYVPGAPVAPGEAYQSF